MPVVPRLEYGSSPAVPSVRKHRFPPPKVRLQFHDLAHSGSSRFLSHIRGNDDIEEQIETVLNLLYRADSVRPGTRSVTFILRDMDGVAYTTGTDLDDDHKEVHLSLKYIHDKDRREILGVLCHELVHCFQWNARGTCPGGLIEGIADWVRLNAGLAAKHWSQDADGAWDGGYQKTGFFLDYLEHRFGPGTVESLNAGLRDREYDEARLFAESCGGRTVGELWRDYGDQLRRHRSRSGEERTDSTRVELPTTRSGLAAMYKRARNRRVPVHWP